VYDQLVPQPGGYMLDAPDSDGDTIRDLGIPVACVLAEHDRALAAPGAELAARVGATPVTVPGTHEAPGISHPQGARGCCRGCCRAPWLSVRITQHA